jgi:hypothetical protein
LVASVGEIGVGTPSLAALGKHIGNFASI